MNEQEIKFQFAGKEVVVIGDSWKYGDFAKAQVEALNPGVATKINQLVSAKLVSIKQAEQESLKALFQSFKSRVKSMVPAEYTVTFLAELQGKNGLVPGYAGQATISKHYKNRKLYFQIEYNDRAYSSDSWYSHKANSPWVMEYNYRTIRYKTLEKLILRGLEKLKDAEETIDRNQEASEKKTQKIAIMEHELNYPVDRETEYSSINHQSYEKIATKTANGFKMFLDRRDDGTYSISKIKTPYMGFRKLTPKQVKAVLSVLSELSKEDEDE